MAGIKRLEGETDSEYWGRVIGIIDGLDYVHTRNGQIVARYPAKYRVVPDAADELTGILSSDYDPDEVKVEILREKYAAAN